MDIAAFPEDLDEIPERLEGLASSLARDPWAIDRESPILLTGMGSSCFAGATAAGWLRAQERDVTAEIATCDPGWRGGPGATAILVSASGSSAETLERAERLGPATTHVALVNNLESPLSARADTVVDMRAGSERSGVASRTYRHTLALLLTLGLPREQVAEACRTAARLCQQFLDDRAWLDDVDRLLDPGVATFWIAPASRMGSAQQSALMIREIPRRLAVACETGDWSHVDVYLTLTMDYRCVVFTGSRWDAPAADWLTKRGSTVVTVGAPLGVPGEFTVPLDADPIARMLVEPIVAEMLAFRWWEHSPVEVP